MCLSRASRCVGRVCTHDRRASALSHCFAQVVKAVTALFAFLKRQRSARKTEDAKRDLLDSDDEGSVGDETVLVILALKRSPDRTSSKPVRMCVA
jgi:hypothetical protein